MGEVAFRMSRNVVYNSAGQLVGYGMQMALWVFTARAVSPAQFGALSIALMLVNLHLIVGDLGMGAALIQRKELSPRHCFGMLAACIGVGCAGVALAWMISPWVASFYGRRIISPLIRLLFCKLLVDSVWLVPFNLAKRRLRFRGIAAIEVVSSTCMLSVGLVALWVWRVGIVAMPLAYLAKAAFQAVSYWVFFPAPLAVPSSFGPVRELVSFGKHIVGFRVLSYVAGHVDIAAIGKLLGNTALGWYSVAMGFVNIPRQRITAMVSAVGFPEFSRLDEGEMASAYLRVSRLVASVNMPLLFGLMALAPLMVDVVLPPRWAPVVPTMQVLCVYGAAWSLTALAGMVFNASGKPWLSVLAAAGMLSTSVLSVLAGYLSGVGILGVAVCMSFFAVGMNLLTAWMVEYAVGVSLWRYYRALFPPLASALVMCVVLVLSVRLAAYGGVQRVYLLPLLAAWGGACYVVVLFLLDAELPREIARMARGVVRREGGG